MTFPVLTTGAAFHVALKWTDDVQYAINDLAFHVEAGGTAADLAAALDSAYTAAMTPDQMSSAHVTEYDITPYDGVSSAVPFATAVWEGHTGGDWAPQVAQVVSFKTGIADRRARGRIYLPFVAESSTSEGTNSSGTVASMTAAWNTFLSAMGDDGFTPIVASTIGFRTTTVHNPDGSVTSGIPGGPPLAPTSWPIIAATVRAKLGTQRRRQSRI